MVHQFPKYGCYEKLDGDYFIYVIAYHEKKYPFEKCVEVRFDPKLQHQRFLPICTCQNPRVFDAKAQLH